MRPIAALAFSGGLDTSFCVPALIERGYDVVTLFVDTGGVSELKRTKISRRARELGARDHLEVDASEALWETIVTPMVMAGARYQEQYPLLCSDRYLIAKELCEHAESIGADVVAHGCTAMGNDQIRLDQSLRCLCNRPIVAPIRELQSMTDAPRAYEIEWLQSRGFSVDAEVKRYTINENLLGATISGGAIDEFDTPPPDTHRLTAPRADWPIEPVRATIEFRQGRAVALDGRAITGAAMLAELNARFGACGVGRGVYTGDTVIGLKGRIVFEAPGLSALLTAHRALEETTLSAHQNRFKPFVAQRWAELVYAGLYFEPLREDIESFLRSTQRRITGSVAIESPGGTCMAVEIDSANMLTRAGAMYAQHADWSKEDAEGFIRLYGMSSAIAAGAAEANRAPIKGARTCSTGR